MGRRNAQMYKLQTREQARGEESGSKLPHSKTSLSWIQKLVVY